MNLFLKRRARSLVFAGTCLVALAACSKKESVETEDPTPKPSGQPVEKESANTTYKPSFTGQTRIAGATTTSNISSTILTSALASPWGIASLPNGSLLVTEKTGHMRIVSATGTVSETITGIPTVNHVGQGGLLGLCIDPDFSTNRMVYWSFSEPGAGGNKTAIAKGRLADNERTIENAAVIYRSTPGYAGTLHYGGRVVFDRSGNLYVSTGERSDLATRPLAQSLEASLGKVLRITKIGQALAGNPFAGQGAALAEIYSIGHRNPQGLAIHPVTGELWQAEHGPRGGDELNRIQAGANYGWPTITYGLEYSGQPILTGIQQKEGMTQPIYYWDPVISPSGMTFYSGDRIPEWKSNLFIGALSGMHIVRLIIEDNKVIGEERLLTSEKQRFRDITQGKDGALYAITDQGRLYKIDKAL